MNLKMQLKELVLRNSFLRKIFVLLYRCRGRRPWSLGYSVYKFDYIKEAVKNDLEYFRNKQLPSGYGARLDERVVEYPWVLSKLDSGARKILDAGSALNHSDILTLDILKDRQLFISTLAYEGFSAVRNPPSYIFEDIREMCYKDEFFDAIICLSTLEHVGMDNAFLYTQEREQKPHDQNAYLEAVRQFKRVLKKNSTLYLTMPYGAYKNYRWFQIFDAPMISRLVQCFEPSKVSEDYFKYEDQQWHFSNAKDCVSGFYFDIHHERRYRQDYLAASQCVVCLALTK